MTTPEVTTFDSFSKEKPFTLVDRFAGALRPEILGHRVPVLSAEDDSLVVYGTYGVAGADSWVHEGRYSDKRRAPLLFNWRVLLGLNAHGKPYLAELIERKHLALAALVWNVARPVMKRYNVCTFELYSRALQIAYADHIDPSRDRDDVPSATLRQEELPVFIHYYTEQMNDPAYILAVKSSFDCTYAAISDSIDAVGKYVAAPSLLDVSMIYMDLIRGGPRPELSQEVIPPDYPMPPFGPRYPGEYLYELLYANTFRYRYGGVSVLQKPVVRGKELPSALVVDFNRFIPYRIRQAAFYNKLKGTKNISIYDLALLAADVFRNHYYGVLHDQNCADYYEFLAYDGESPRHPTAVNALATSFIIPLPILKNLTDKACNYGVNYLVGLSTREKKNRKDGILRVRRAVSPKSVLEVSSPDTPHLAPSEFRFTYRYHCMLISPPWPLTLTDVRDYYRETPGKPPKTAAHLDRTYVSLDTLRRLPVSQTYLTPELMQWLRGYAQMNKYVFKAEIKMLNKQCINKVVREELGVKGVRFRPEEDDAILRLYRARMSAASKEELKRICFGRSTRSISLRAGVLRRELMSKGVYDLGKLPHGMRSESLLAEIRAAKRMESNGQDE